MSREREEPVYYREIQKNGYLKRVPPDCGGRLRPLGHKRAAPEAMWTVFCVHNGRTAYLEQYAAQEAAGEHRPAWRACLQRARHVTASVRPWPGDEFDFLVAAEPPVRMLAPNWDAMQEWVATLRAKLQELKLLARGENVYCAPPAPPPPRAGTRDPTSPLPPTPAGPAVRVPGIEPIAAPSSAARSSTPSGPEAAPEPAASSSAQPVAPGVRDSVEQGQECSVFENGSDEPRERLSDWDAAIQLESAPATSHHPPERATKKTARICGQNVCLDDSVLRRTDDSDEEFFAEIDRINSGAAERFGDYVVDEAFEGASCENGDRGTVSAEETSRFGEGVDGYTAARGYAQRVVVAGGGVSCGAPNATNNSGTNITVIQVSNSRGPPHTAIPVLGSEVDVFDFEFKQKLSIGAADEPPDNPQEFVNIVNTEESVHVRDENVLVGNENVLVRNENGYGAVFNTSDESPYGHISLTTTVELTCGKVTEEGIYERLCMASTSNDNAPSQQLAKRKTKDNLERLRFINGRKTSLPNLEIESKSSDSNPAYEYVFPSNNNFRGNINNSKTIHIKDVNTIDSKVPTEPTESQANVNTTISSSTLTLSSITAPSSTPTGLSTTRAISRNAPSAQTNASSAIVTQSMAHSILVSSPRRSVERTRSQSSYDAVEPQGRGQRHSPRREGAAGKNERGQQGGARGLFARGLTELSFLSRLKGLGQGARQPPREPLRADCEPVRPAASPTRVVRRSRADARPADPARRRSSSLSGAAERIPGGEVSLRARQAAALRAEQARGAAAAARLPRRDAKREPPVLCDAHGVVWVAWWGRGGAWFGGRAGDRVAAVRGVRPRDAAHARQLLRQALSSLAATVDVLFHRVPHAKIYILTKDKEEDRIGIKLDGECGIVSVEADSAAARAGLPPAGPRWAVTEVNNRPLDLLKGGDEEVARLSGRGREVSVLLQPLPLVQRLRSALRAHRIRHAVVGLAG